MTVGQRRTIIIIRTTERAGADYLPELVHLVEREHYNGGIILTDGPVPRVFFGWQNRATGRCLGSRYSGWAAFKVAAGMEADLLLLEDDVLPCPGGVAEMYRWQVAPHLAFVSFFDAQARARTPGLVEVPCHDFHYAQAVKFPYETLAALAECDPANFTNPGFPPRHAFDTTVGAFCSELLAVPRMYGVVVPNLVEHRGDVSVVWPRRQYPFHSAWLATDAGRADEEPPTVKLAKPGSD